MVIYIESDETRTINEVSAVYTQYNIHSIIIFCLLPIRWNFNVGFLTAEYCTVRAYHDLPTHLIFVHRLLGLAENGPYHYQILPQVNRDLFCNFYILASC